MTTQTQAYVSGNGDSRQTLVVVFLRGGADGLNLVAPLEDPGYYKYRPRIALSKQEAVKLDGFFGLNPLLKDLAPLYQAGNLAIVHGAGSEDATRSHFEAQDLMEHGGMVAGGWLGRFLRYRQQDSGGSLSAMAIGKALPECLRGAPAATVLESLEDFSLGKNSARLTRELTKLYTGETGALGQSARDTLGALQRMDQLRATRYVPEHDAQYSYDGFAQGLKQVARLIKAQVGLEAVSIDLGGWDSHLNQSNLMDPLMRRLGSGLAAFHRDLGTRMNQVSVVVMTEFGRRVMENSAFGTDHGRGSVMFVLGGGVKGGRVFGPWTELKADLLEGPGDLPVVNNYRNVLAPVLQRHSPSADFKKIFPEFTLSALPLYT
jgi:uncharacterized protein (DUF1501 family)